jgi:hypothetical protein
MSLTADEKTVFAHSLARHRAVVLWELEDLDDDQLRRPVVPSCTRLLGLVKHLAGVEYGWFCDTFGRQVELVPFDIDEDPESDMRVEPAETAVGIVAFYKRACAAADAAIAETDLDGLGRSWSGDSVSMRWVLVHMIEETARHAGHMDIGRELLDGATGDHRRRESGRDLPEPPMAACCARSSMRSPAITFGTDLPSDRSGLPNPLIRSTQPACLRRHRCPWRAEERVSQRLRRRVRSRPSRSRTWDTAAPSSWTSKTSRRAHAVRRCQDHAVGLDVLQPFTFLTRPARAPPPSLGVRPTRSPAICAAAA